MSNTGNWAFLRRYGFVRSKLPARLHIPNTKWICSPNIAWLRYHLPHLIVLGGIAMKDGFPVFLGHVSALVMIPATVRVGYVRKGYTARLFLQGTSFNNFYYGTGAIIAKEQDTCL